MDFILKNLVAFALTAVLAFSIGIICGYAEGLVAGAKKHHLNNRDEYGRLTCEICKALKEMR